MIDGFYLYIYDILEGFIHSNVIPREHDVIDYKDTLYIIVTVKHCIEQDKDIGDATIRRKVSSIKVYAIL